MVERIKNWINNHPKTTTLFLFAAIFFTLPFSLYFGLANVNGTNQLEKAKSADFIRYTVNGEMVGLDYEVIVDMNTGYQYLIFNINGNYVAVPRVDEDGSFYKTIE